MPVGHTLAELFGHLVFCFTRSVAEHYSFDEPENHSDLFGYNALEDTGKEWYCKSVDEVIYQEYSNSEATARDYLASSSLDARLIDACSTEESNETDETHDTAAMAWKQLRPSIFCTVLNSLYFGFLLSISSAAVVGITCILGFYLSFQTMLNCKTYHSKPESIPIKLQWVKTISEIVVVLLYYCWFYLNILLYFRPFQISGLKLKLFLIGLACYCLDVVYRVAMQALGMSHSELSPTQKIPLMFVFFLCIFIQVFVIVRHFCRGPRKTQCKLFALTASPCVLTYITAVLIAYFVYPAYNRQDRTGKMIIAIFTPLISAVVKGACRICVQRIARFGHPGTSFVMLVPMYCGSAVMLRLLQVDLRSLESVAVIGVIHGIAEVIERSSMVLIDHICHQFLEKKRKIPWGGFRTPRRERLSADISIMSMLYESSALISVNGFLYLYQHFYTRGNSPFELLQSFAITTSVPLAIEWFFTSVSIAIETRYQNMPVMAVWRKRWRRHIVVALINAMALTVWTCTYLYPTVEDRFCSDFCVDHCDMPFSRL